MSVLDMDSELNEESIKAEAEAEVERKEKRGRKKRRSLEKKEAVAESWSSASSRLG
jgi:hypothetical protein